MLKFSENFRIILPSLILLITCFSLYGPNLSSDYFLDDHMLKQKPQLHDLQNIPDYFLNPLMGEHRYRPLSDVVRAVQFQFFQYDIVKYRYFNLTAFYVLCVLVYYLIRRLTADQFFSLTTSILFSIHAINTTLVQYVWNLDTILATIFLILSSFVALDYFYTQSWKDCALSLIFYVVAVLFAEISLIFPMYLVLFTFYIEKNRRELKVYLKQILPFIVVALGYLLIRQKVANFTSLSMSYAESLDLSFGSYIASMGSLVLWYASKLIYPHNLLIIWNTQPIHEISTSFSFFFLAAVMFLVWKVVFVWKKRVVSMALIWFISGFLPLALGMFIMPFLGLVIEPHWFAFSSIGGMLLISWGLSKLKEITTLKIFGALVSVFIAFHGIMTVNYNHKWESEKTYCQYWVKLKPDNHFANSCLAASYFRDQQFNQAKTHLKRSLLGNSMDWQTYGNLGYIAHLQGNAAEAKFYYNKALSINPQAETVRSNLKSLKTH